MNQKKFDKSISELVTALKAEIRRSNPIYLMSLLNQKLIQSINPENPHRNLPDGFTQKFHYIYGLIVSAPLPSKKSIRTNYKIDETLNITEKLFQEYIFFLFSSHNFDGSQDAKKVQEYSAGLFSFFTTLHQPKLGSSEQFIQFTLDRFKAFDQNFFIPQIGLTTQQCLDISLAIIRKVSVQYQEAIKDYVEAMKPMTEMWHQFRAGEITLEESSQRVKEDPIFKQANEQLKNNTLKFINSFVISSEDFDSQFSQPEIESFFVHFSCKPGKINKNFRYPTDFNELNTKLLVEINSGKYYVPEVTRLFHKIPIILETKLLDSKQAQTYFKYRDKLTQKSTVELLKQVFIGDNILEEAYYGYKNNQEFETDVLISHGHTLLICEIKAKALRNPLYTKGNVDKIKSDFKASVQKAYEQALRTRDYILSQEIVSFVDKKGRHLCDLQRDNFDNYLLIVVTAESFGCLTTDLSLLLEKEQDAPYPWAISQFDLELLLTRIDTPDRLFDYIRQRCQLHGSVFASDELDFAGYYLRYGNLNFNTQLKKADKMVLEGNFSRIFDEDWYETHGFKIEKKDKEPSEPYYSVFERYGNEVSIGMEGFPDTFETLHIGSKTRLEKSMPKMTSRNRNMSCPCESGKKYKNCHGKPEWLL